MSVESRAWEGLSEFVSTITQGLQGVRVYGVTVHLWNTHLPGIRWASVHIEGRVDDLGRTFESLRELKAITKFEVRPYDDWQQITLSLEVGHKPESAVETLVPKPETNDEEE